MVKAVTLKDEVITLLNRIRDDSRFGMSYSQSILFLFGEIDKLEQEALKDRRNYVLAIAKLEEHGIKF